ncbi:cation:proton antiporter [Parvibaculum sp.]|uniref:cation:proton antiporter n=1 Tax=Parvibaculum sp. TaxID=2024848 RepID=UPI0027301665|nr:cation:proton antiporter family protein [Parvibaculum sp.]MDP1628248.1 cation:proton antiporter [Parvibaculum sp.]MDP2150033.1 cation:proton antiporter [Parvibaculum sp.]MDP3330324.1 cation:proton antiporter [Parvibaculum sp.]
MPEVSVFYEIAALLMLASVVGVIGLRLRQPMIVSFIIVGMLAGPAGFDIVRSTDHLQLLSELGVTLLLFLVGLKLDLNLVRTLGTVALSTGLGQIAFTSIAGFLICLGLGMPVLMSLYVAVALTFSSTIIIVKLLSDKRELDALHGRIALGFLIVQDLAVVVAMAVMSAMTAGSGSDAGMIQALLALAAGAVPLVLLWLFVLKIANPLLQSMAKAPELLIVFALGLAAAFAALGDYLGFSKELGGLIAGVALASTPFREAIASRLGSLRDFLLVFFFISLGSHLDLRVVGDAVGDALFLSLFVLIGNPLIVMIIMGAMGYRKRTGFLAGLTVAQISEFSLIFVAMGLALGHVTEEAVGLVTLVGVITIGLSTYMILYSQRLYIAVERFLGVFERRVAHREEQYADGDETQRYDVLLLGLGRYGRALYSRFSESGLNVLGIDFDPDVIRQWKDSGAAVMYGDLLDPDMCDILPIAGVDYVILAVPPHQIGITHEDPRITLIEALRHRGYGGHIAVIARSESDMALLRQKGADIVLSPFADAAERAMERLFRKPIPFAID